jgi:hypothetical protein
MLSLENLALTAMGLAALTALVCVVVLLRESGVWRHLNPALPSGTYVDRASGKLRFTWWWQLKCEVSYWRLEESHTTAIQAAALVFLQALYATFIPTTGVDLVEHFQRFAFSPLSSGYIYLVAGTLIGTVGWHIIMRPSARLLDWMETTGKGSLNFLLFLEFNLECLCWACGVYLALSLAGRLDVLNGPFWPWGVLWSYSILASASPFFVGVHWAWGVLGQGAGVVVGLLLTTDGRPEVQVEMAMRWVWLGMVLGLVLGRAQAVGSPREAGGEGFLWGPFDPRLVDAAGRGGPSHPLDPAWGRALTGYGVAALCVAILIGAEVREKTIAATVFGLMAMLGFCYGVEKTFGGIGNLFKSKPGLEPAGTHGRTRIATSAELLAANLMGQEKKGR